MACVKFVKGLILDRLAFENFSLVYKSKIHVMYKIERKIKEIIHSWIDDIIIQNKNKL
jgi:hypothetical protein